MSKLIIFYGVGKAVGVLIVNAVNICRLKYNVGVYPAARRAAAVSVEKNGLPVPQPNITTLPFSR